MELLRTEALRRSFPSGGETVDVLKGLDLVVPKGVLAMVQGRSGSGKTTLLNLLGALDRPTSGRVWFEGAEIGSLPDAARDRIRRFRMGFVFQSIALLASMSAFENVDFGLRVARYDPKARAARAVEALERVGLGSRLRHRAHELSGGEQQRVAIARAIAHRPAVLFADEPTAELDTAMGLQVAGLFRRLVDEEGVTVVMTTHDPNMLEFADLVLPLDEGASR